MTAPPGEPGPAVEVPGAARVTPARVPWPSVAEPVASPADLLQQPAAGRRLTDALRGAYDAGFTDGVRTAIEGIVLDALPARPPPRTEALNGD